jgi:hypothetical protein
MCSQMVVVLLWIAWTLKGACQQALPEGNARDWAGKISW